MRNLLAVSVKTGVIEITANLSLVLRKTNTKSFWVIILALMALSTDTLPVEHLCIVPSHHPAIAQHIHNLDHS